MRNTLLMILLLGGLLTGCTAEELPEEHTASIQFHLSRAGDGVLPHQQTRLFVAQRAQENQMKDGTALYCGRENRHFLQSNSFRVDHLLLQAYKFAFVSVPHYPEMKVSATEFFSDTSSAAQEKEKQTTDFCQLLVDYSPVFRLLEKDAKADEKYEMSIYRGIVNRWTSRPNPDNIPDEETVTLKRVSGKLKMVMGKLTDQFAYPVKRFDLHFVNMPKRIFIYDNATIEDHLDEYGKPVESDAQVVADLETATDWTYQYVVSEEERQGTKDCLLSLPLLPHTMLGTYLTVVVDRNGQQEELSFPVVGKDEQDAVKIKPNTVTRILFHGMEPQQFKVEYAGYDDTMIDVDDQWNGGW